MLHKKPEKMTLPMCATFLTGKSPEGFVAHSLDFDLVAVAMTKELAIARLRRTVKLYIEHGIENRWEDDILFSAPEQYWARMTVDTPICLGEPITLEDRTVRVFNVDADAYRCAVAAS